MRRRLYVVFCGRPGPLAANGMGTYVRNDAITATYRPPLYPAAPTETEDR